MAGKIPFSWIVFKSPLLHFFLPVKNRNQHALGASVFSPTSVALTDFPPVLLHMPFLEVIDVDRNSIRYFPSLAHLSGLKLVIYDHNPCRNAPKVAKGVRRVGRWAEETPEPDPRKARRYALAREESQEAQLPALPPPLLPTNS